MGARSVRKRAAESPYARLLDELPLVQYPIRESGVDWITCTCADSDSRACFDALGHRLIADEAQAGVDVLPWRFEQFDGLNAGQVAFGRNHEMSVLRLSAYLAAHHWKEAFELSTNCSRFDYQVTVEGVGDGAQLIRDCEREARLYVEGWSNPPEVTMRDSNRTGPTCYLGTRQSNWYGRIYDKFVESKLPDFRDCVRFEVQFNKRAAQLAATIVVSDPLARATGIGLVHGHLQRRGVRRRWSDDDVFQVTCHRGRGNAARRLAWIRKQVAPAIAKLIDSGHQAEVLEALGLSALVYGPTGPPK